MVRCVGVFLILRSGTWSIRWVDERGIFRVRVRVREAPCFLAFAGSGYWRGNWTCSMFLFAVRSCRVI